MAHKKAAIKHLRQTKIRTTRNKAVKAGLKSILKKTDHAAEAKGADLDALVRSTIQSLDKAARRGVIKKNTAARKKSRLLKRINKQGVQR